MSAVATTIEFDDLEIVNVDVLVRVSEDRSGRLRSNAEQLADNDEVLAKRAKREHRPWVLGRVYDDGEGSASEHQRKRRVTFDGLVADLESGRFSANVLAVWEISRGSRQVDEWVKLIRLCTQLGVQFLVIGSNTLLDPGDPDDRARLYSAAVAAEIESLKTSKRTKRATKNNAKAGTFSGGRRPYGYAKDGVTIVPHERDVILDCVKALLGGRSVRAIAKDLNAAGEVTSTGKAWHPGPLRTILASARIAGMSSHDRAVVGPAAWPAIIDDAQHRRILAVLAASARTPSRGRQSWMLTGLLRCGKCNATLIGNTDIRGVRRYICRKGPGYDGCGGLAIKAEPLEEKIGDLVAERLADAEARRAAHVGPDDSVELAELADLELAEAAAIEDETLGVITRDQSNAKLKSISRRRSEVEGRLAAKVRQQVPLQLIVDEVADARPFGDRPVEQQKATLKAMIASITVASASTRGSNRFEAARVTAPGRIDWLV